MITAGRPTRWFWCGLLGCLWLMGGRLAAAQQPNIVLILADDLGWQEAGFLGSDFLETPHLDRLAREGMVFRQAYIVSARAGAAQSGRSYRDPVEQGRT